MTFPLVKARRLAVAASSSYLPPSQQEQMAAVLPFKAEFFEAGSDRAVLYQYHGRAVLVGVGSNDWRDWISNFQQGPVDLWIAGRMVDMHRGFSDPYLALEKDLIRAVGAQLDAGKKVYMACHSRGAWIAPLALRFPEVELWQYQVPRFGSAKMAQAFEDVRTKAATRRLVLVDNGVQDLVSRVPLSVRGWQHVGEPTLVVRDRAGVRLEHGAQHWEALRARRPVRAWETLMVLARLGAGARAHSHRRMVEALAELEKQNEREHAAYGRELS